MNLTSTGAKNRPALDEGSFQQILAAAYVVQQHNDGQRSRNPALATSSVLTEISEIQARLRAGSLDLIGAAQLTAERLQKITSSGSVNISLLTNGSLESTAYSGPNAPESQIPLSCYSFSVIERLKRGELFQSADTARDISLNSTACQSANVRSLLAAPIRRFDEFVGVIEVRWSRGNAFNETDARASQLMAGLISGILERSARSLDRKSVSQAPPVTNVDSEISSPHPEAENRGDHSSPASVSLSSDLVPGKQIPVAEPEGSVETGRIQSALPDYCRVCGRPFGENEVFCGQCSMPRVAGAGADDLQSKWASLWYLQKAQNARPDAVLPSTTRRNGDDFPPLETRSETVLDLPSIPEPSVKAVQTRVWHVAEPKPEPEPVLPLVTEPALKSEPARIPEEKVKIARSAPVTWNRDLPLVPAATMDASEGPDLLQSTWHTVWLRMRRRHAMFAISAVGALLLFLMLAVWPAGGNSQLTLFQSLLVELGLAEVPSHPPVLAGNPDTRVWVDVHTALYYCPGSDLYGKTPGGHFATQREAQQDEFEPASRVVCP